VGVLLWVVIICPCEYGAESPTSREGATPHRPAAITTAEKIDFVSFCGV
jgi:hypothetical protein